MDVLTILFIFMITTSITLTGFVIRQRKNNRMLGELVAQTKVENAQRYSQIGVGVRNQAYVSKCPACAEWVNLEAKVCKSCQNNLEGHNLNLREKMQRVDENIADADKARIARNKKQREAVLKNPFFRALLGILLVITIIVAGIRIQSTVSYYRATSTPSSSLDLIKSWNSIIDECKFLGTVTKPRAVDDDLGGVNLGIQLGIPLQNFDWKSRLGQEIICFSEKALSIDVSKELDVDAVNNIHLRNSFKLFGANGTAYVAFYWN
jgi:hypothetical protein